MICDRQSQITNPIRIFTYTRKLQILRFAAGVWTLRVKSATGYRIFVICVCNTQTQIMRYGNAPLSKPKKALRSRNLLPGAKKCSREQKKVLPRWDISLKLGAKVRRRIKHRDISYVQVIQSLAELRKFGGRDDQPKAYSIWDSTFAYCQTRAPKTRALIPALLWLTAFHAIIFMRIAGLVSMATPFTKIDWRGSLKRIFFLLFWPMPTRVGGWEPLFS